MCNLKYVHTHTLHTHTDTQVYVIQGGCASETQGSGFSSSSLNPYQISGNHTRHGVGKPRHAR